jgi:hypothetical protein
VSTLGGNRSRGSSSELPTADSNLSIILVMASFGRGTVVRLLVQCFQMPVLINCAPLPLNTLPSTVLQSNLPPGANRILFVKNLNYTITGDDLYDLFGRYGSIRQIRLGNEAKTKGTAFVVFDDVMDVRSFCVISIYLSMQFTVLTITLTHLRTFSQRLSNNNIINPIRRLRTLSIT